MIQRKTTALKKYEADPTQIVIRRQDPDMELLSPFGPMIAKTRISDGLLNMLNTYADTLVTPGTSSEYILPEHIVFNNSEPTLADYIADCIGHYLESLEHTITREVEFETFWIVSQYAGTPSPVHFHSGDISGVMYLKTPDLEHEELEKTYISGRHAGYINFISGGKQRYSKSIISFAPQVGDLYIFPGWLLHGAEPFRGDGERRSIAFNAFIAE